MLLTDTDFRFPFAGSATLPSFPDYPRPRRCFQTKPERFNSRPLMALQGLDPMQQGIVFQAADCIAAATSLPDEAYRWFWEAVKQQRSCEELADCEGFDSRHDCMAVTIRVAFRTLSDCQI